MLTLTLPEGATDGDCRINARPCEFRLVPGHLEWRYKDEGPGFRRRRIAAVVSVGNGLLNYVCENDPDPTRDD
jgi:hypothetical protein